MQLIVGLGNPGTKYENTRHNIGFALLDLMVEAAGAQWSSGRFESSYSRGRIHGCECVFLKPFTYMNLSGKAVKLAAGFFKIPPEMIVVVHDDIDLEWGKVKTRKSGGHGGHNGVRSIIAELGSNQFPRIKVGVGRPSGPIDVSSWVLSKIDPVLLDEISGEIMDTTMVRLENVFQSFK